METFPPSPQAGFFAVMVPNRIFVGGFSASTTEHELRSFFEQYGVVREVKIIRDDDDELSENASAKKRKYSYGFVTFTTDQDAKRIIEMSKAQLGHAFKFQGRLLNVSEAIKKPPANRMRIDNAVAMSPTSFILRDFNGMMTICPGYTVVPPTEYTFVPAQNIAMPPPMMPVYMQQPQSPFSIPSSTPITYIGGSVLNASSGAPTMCHSAASQLSNQSQCGGYQ